jgi:serine/threonine protein phosphatase PrpC
MTLHLRWAAVTDQGHVRSSNQDTFYAGDRLLVVADGMGGMAAGDVASRLAVDAMTSLDVAIDNEHQMDALHKALEVANGRIAETVAGDNTLQGMGTTLTAVVFSGDRAALAHVGDSRAYLLRDGRLNQLTKDDTYVQMLVDQGLIRPEEAGSHPRRAVVTQALQGEPVSPSYPNPAIAGCCAATDSPRSCRPMPSRRRCSPSPIRRRARSDCSTSRCRVAARTTSRSSSPIW